jgi:pimeloyl-ACP methyl ester carboxylesterase
MDIYLLCGLGADERLFSYLDLSGLNVTAVKWVVPLDNETMPEYARRLLPQIVSSDPVLMGVSFGGMVAIEIGKLIPTRKIILISSSATRTELPWLYRAAGKLKIHRLIPGFLLKRSHVVMNWIMGATDPARRDLLADMLKKTNSKFLYWAIDKVVTWMNDQTPLNVIRIHGTSDKVLPLRNADYAIEGGGHLIVANRAKEVDGILKTVLRMESTSLNQTSTFDHEPAAS